MADLTGKTTCTAGIGVRRDVRRWLLENGLQFTEDKGWFDSLFIVSGPLSKITKFRCAVSNWNAD